MAEDPFFETKRQGRRIRQRYALRASVAATCFVFTSVLHLAWPDALPRPVWTFITGLFAGVFGICIGIHRAVWVMEKRFIEEMQR